MRLAFFVLVGLCRTVQATPIAEEYFNAGQSAYDQGNYTLAVGQWRESYRLSQQPALLYNLGQAYRLAGDCASALASYRQYVVLEPRSEQSDLARRFVGELEPKCGSALVARRTDLPRQSSGRSLQIAGLVSGGAGALSLVIGLGAGHHASTLGDEVSAACAVDCNWSSQQAKDSAGRRDAAIGYTLDIIGIAVILGGSVMYLFGSRENAISLSISPQQHERGALIVWSRTW